MADPSAEDLAAVFGGEGKEGAPPPMGDEPGPPPTEEAPPDADQTAALDGAIDDMFSTDDPVARREAFKRACALCAAAGY